VSVPRWGYLHYLFPGLLGFTIFVSGLYGMGYNMVRYRRALLLRKLALTPLRRPVFVAAQILGRTVVVVAQMVLLVAVACALFALPLGPAQAAWLFGLVVVGVLTFLGAGFALACVFRSEENMNDAIGAVMMPVVLLSEMFFPVDHLPAPLAHLAGVLPSTLLVRLVRAVVIYGETGLGALAPGLGALAVWAVVTYGISLWAFKWND
jgi:ABC-type multidrug transport system permease subunit